MSDRYASLLAPLRELAAAAGPPPEFAAYLEKVARHAYRVTDSDVEVLREAGFSEEQIFDETARAAAAAGLARYDAGLRALA